MRPKVASSPAGYWMVLAAMILIALAQAGDDDIFARVLLGFAVALGVVALAFLIAYYRK